MAADQGRARIIAREAGKPEQVLELKDRLTIGRSPSNDLVIEDRMVSRTHAEIRRVEGERYIVSDLGSANGTWLNGRRVTVPRALENGDKILVASVELRFVAPKAVRAGETTMGPETATFMRNEWVVVLVADIRNFTSMSEALPNLEFALLIKDWFRECSEIISKNGGTLDKFIGDAVMAYWVTPQGAGPKAQVDTALAAAQTLQQRAGDFSAGLSKHFPGQSFAVGIGISAGEAMLGNVGIGEIDSFTIVGDSVSVAFRLEALSKEKGAPVVVSGSVRDHAAEEFRFRSLGHAEVKGRKEPVALWALEQ